MEHKCLVRFLLHVWKETPTSEFATEWEEFTHEVWVHDFIIQQVKNRLNIRDDAEEVLTTAKDAIKGDIVDVLKEKDDEGYYEVICTMKWAYTKYQNQDGLEYDLEQEFHEITFNKISKEEADEYVS